MMARTKNYIISHNCHMIGMIFTRCFGILFVILQFSRPADLMMNLKFEC